jgi:hypothetical protein
VEEEEGCKKRITDDRSLQFFHQFLKSRYSTGREFSLFFSIYLVEDRNIIFTTFASGLCKTHCTVQSYSEVSSTSCTELQKSSTGIEVYL